MSESLCGDFYQVNWILFTNNGNPVLHLFHREVIFAKMIENVHCFSFTFYPVHMHVPLGKDRKLNSPEYNQVAFHIAVYLVTTGSQKIIMISKGNKIIPQ